jgi:hypothetical protein
MLLSRASGAVCWLLMAAVACAPETMGAPQRPASRPAADGGKAAPDNTGAGGAGSIAPPPVQAGAGGDTGLFVPPTPQLVAGTAGAAAGGAGADPDADCGAIRQQAESIPGAVDIVWVIDGSGSMADEQAAVQKNITSFAEAIGSAGIDHHVVMIAKDNVAAGTPLAGDATHYRHVSVSIGSRDALQKLIESYTQYSDFLRPSAALHFVIVTDDESRMTSDDFRTQMEALAGKPFTAHAIVSESLNGLACIGACGLPILCGAAAPGLQYLALADATSGQKASICTSDWSTVFEPLKMAVIESAPLPCEYALPAPPSGSSLDPTRVNVDVLLGGSGMKTLPRATSAGECESAEAWFYDDPSAPTLIKMCPAACSSVSGGGAIEIRLGCETVSLN